MTNRIDQLTVSLPSDRQTANNDFGAMLARGVSSSASFAGAASAMIPGGAVLSAAINRTAAAATRETSARGAVGGHGQSGAQATVPASGDELSSQRDLMETNQQWSEQYLSLQMAMQQESREFTAVSNVLKVRHESAKTAINNIR